MKVKRGTELWYIQQQRCSRVVTSSVSNESWRGRKHLCPDSFWLFVQPNLRSESQRQRASRGKRMTSTYKGLHDNYVSNKPVRQLHAFPELLCFMCLMFFSYTCFLFVFYQTSHRQRSTSCLTLAAVLACLVILGIILAISVLERLPAPNCHATLPQEPRGGNFSTDQCRYWSHCEPKRVGLFKGLRGCGD